MTKDLKLFWGIIIFLSIALLIIACTLITESNGIFSLVLIIWSGLSIYCILDIKDHIVFLFFLISFFVFLIGRELCFAFFNLEKYYRYLEEYNNLTFFLMALSLLCLFLGYYLAEKYYFASNLRNMCSVKHRTKDFFSVKEDNNKRRFSIRAASRIIYLFCLICSLIDVTLQIKTVNTIGYLGTYVGSNANTPTIIGYLSSFTLIALSILLSTFPSKKESLFALLLYEFYGALTMMTGHRYTFVAISMYFLTYIVYRHKMEGHWISKKLILLSMAAIPFIIILMNTIDASRNGYNNTNSNFLRSLISFLDQQGGSINVIKRVSYYKNAISDMVLTSFSNTRAILLENAIMRKLFGVIVYSGNSIENAMNGHFLAHRLSYLEYGDYYLLGHGTGSCYIAELFHDFSFGGVIAGNVIYGYIIRRVTDIGNRHYFRNALLLASQHYIYLAPRGDFDGMVGGLFSLTSLLGIAAILALSFLFSNKGDHYDKKLDTENIHVSL